MFRRPGSIKLMDVLGIRIGVDPGWFLMLFLVILWLSPSFRGTLHGSDGQAYLTTVVSALLFFGSLIVHELGHALMARRQGIEVKSIQLFLFGGLTQMGRDTRSPGEEFKVAVAGPLATLAMVVVFLVVDLAIVGPHRLWHAFLLDGQVTVTPVLLALSWLLLMNLVVLLFNLVPAFPLDGGRIARAIVWRLTNDKRRGTRAAAQLGQGFAVILAGVGIWLALSGGGAFSGIWLILLGFLLGQSARGALVQTALTERIEGVRVADIMDRQPVAIPSQTPVAQALEEYFLRYGWSWFPVIDEEGRFLGIARQEVMQAAVDRGEGWLTASAGLAGGESAGWHVDEDRPLTEVLASESLGRIGALMAVDAEGVLRGVVTVEQVRRALQSALGTSVV
ncbi:MAG TPA: site-2 protease family protein [Solirubrobacteraceae bacterium]